MHICLLSREYPWRQPFGGVGVSTANTARALVQDGQSVTVVTQSPSHEIMEQKEPNLHVRGLPLHTPAYLPPRLARFSAIETAAWSRIAAHEILSGRLGPIDIVEAPEGGGEALSLLRNRRRPPTVVRIRGGSSLGLRTRDLYRWFHYPVYHRERRSIELADRLAALSEQAWHENERHFGISLSDVTVLPNALDTDRFTPAPEPAADPVTVLFVGRMDAVKGFDLIPAIVTDVLVREPQTRFRFVGADRRVSREIQETSMNFLLSRLSPEQRNCVSFAGTVATEAMPEEYRQCHILLAPSRTEAAGRVCIESAGCGLPVVGSRDTGMESIVVEGATGYLEPIGEAAAFARRIVELVRDEDKRRTMGQAARQRAVQAFSFEAVAKQTAGFYRDTIGRLSPSPSGRGSG